jgi:protocatechuate 4,5-dioxygenase beta chain/2,3-dihydroxyphenylpropionate 1,2-dioxygenase
MPKVFAAFAGSHAPGISGWPERADPRKKEAVYDAFNEARRRLDEFNPDVVIGISVEHFTNFNFGNLPAFAIATADSYLGPVTQAMSEFLNVKQHYYPGNGQLGRHIYEYAIAHEFDPALVEGGLDFDENFCVPLSLLDPESKYPLVPIIINGVNPPWPTAKRSYDFGAMIRQAVESFEGVDRIAVIGTGGLSHWVGLPESGTINEDFDRDFINRMQSGDPQQLTSYSPTEIDEAGNGAHEVRTWIATAGVMGAIPWEILAYEPTPEWLTGTAVAVCTPSLTT